MNEPKRRSSTITRFGGAVQRWAPPLLVGCALILIGLTAESLRRQDERSKPGRDESESTIPVNTIIAERDESVFEVRTYSGIIRARRSADLGFDRGGRIKRLLVREGDFVNQGDPIAEIDQRRLELKKLTLTDALEQANADLEALDPNAPALSNDVMRIEIQKLQFELDQLEADIDASEQAAQGLPPDSLERLRSLERRVGNLNLASRTQQIDELNSRITELDSELQDLELQLEDGVIVAPFDGVISLKNTSVGAVVPAGQPVVRIVEEQLPQAWVGIPNEIVSQIEINQTAWVTVGSTALTAIARAKLPQVDQSTRTRTVIFELEDDQFAATLVPGQVVNVRFWVENPMSGFWVPISSLQREIEGLWSVFVVEDQEDRQVLSRRYVELMRLDSEVALIEGTLEEGDVVVVEGTHRVVPGQGVTTEDVTSDFVKPGPGGESGP